MFRCVLAWVRAHPLLTAFLAVLPPAGVALGVAGLLLYALLAGQLRQEPVAVEVLAQYPGASAEEVERQVTIPLEVTFAGMPGLRTTCSQSLPGLAHLGLRFERGISHDRARQEVVNRLQSVQALPAGVTPQIAPPHAAEVLRYTLVAPRDAGGQNLYTPADLRALQDWTLKRDFRRVPRVNDPSSAGGAVKRYEVHPDPDRLRRFGVTLRQLEKVLADSNANVGGDFVAGGAAALNVRGLGLLGGGADPAEQALALKDPREAATRLRAEEERRLREIRQTVIATVNQVPVRVDHVVEGGPARVGEANTQGVVVGSRPRLSRVGLSRPLRDDRGRPVRAADGSVRWLDEDDTVQGIVWLRPGEEEAPARRDTEAMAQQFNDGPGRVLPGVRIAPFPDRAAGAESAEGCLWVHGDFPASASVEEVAARARDGRALLRQYPEVAAVLSQVGGPDDEEIGAPAPSGVEFCLPLRPRKDWPAPAGQGSPRTVAELGEALREDLGRQFPGVDWLVGPERRDPFWEPFRARGGEGLVKVFGPDFGELERLAGKLKEALAATPGVEGVRVVHVPEVPQLRLSVDREKCARWGVTVADVNDVIQVMSGKVCTQMVEGEKTFDVTLRWPKWRRGNETAILDLPVDVSNVEVIPGGGGAPPQVGGQAQPANPIASTPRLRLRDLVTPPGRDGAPDPQGQFVRAEASAIYREQGRRLIAVRFAVRGRGAGAVVAEVRKKTDPLVPSPYRMEWGD
jgi:Cu/Ag efflux pump CusA